MSFDVTVTPVIVNPEGATSTERRLDVIHRTASMPVLLALMTESGKIGKAARERAATGGQVGIVQQAASGNYRPLAEYFAARTGDAFVISGRAAFESLPDLFEAKILTARKGKDGGMKTNKDGLEVPGPKLALALELKAIAVECIAEAKRIHEERRAKAEAEQAKLEQDAAQQ